MVRDSFPSVAESVYARVLNTLCHLMASEFESRLRDVKAVVAQRVEQQTFNLKRAGSSPASGTSSFQT